MTITVLHFIGDKEMKLTLARLQHLKGSIEWLDFDFAKRTITYDFDRVPERFKLASEIRVCHMSGLLQKIPF